MASSDRKFSFRTESHIFFIYDHRRKTEADDPKDAILYFYPRSVKTEDQIGLVGGIIGLTDFCLEFLPQQMPHSIKLSGHNFAMLQTEDYILGLSGSTDIPDKFLLEHMQFLWSTFVFYQGSISAIKQRCEEGDFLKELHLVWDIHLPLCQSQGDILGQSFQVVPHIQFSKSQGNIFLHASHILQRSLKHQGVVAGALFNKNKVLCTQFDNSLTRTLLLLMFHSQFPGVDMNPVLELPGGVRLMYIFMTQSDYAKLGYRRKTAFSLEGSCVSDSNKSEQGQSPCLSTDARSSHFGPSAISNNSSSHSTSSPPAPSNPLLRVDSNLSNTSTAYQSSHANISSPTYVQNSGTDSEVFVDSVSDFKNQSRLSDRFSDKENAVEALTDLVKVNTSCQERGDSSNDALKKEDIFDNGTMTSISNVNIWLPGSVSRGEMSQPVEKEESGSDVDVVNVDEDISRKAHQKDSHTLNEMQVNNSKSSQVNYIKGVTTSNDAIRPDPWRCEQVEPNGLHNEECGSSLREVSESKPSDDNKGQISKVKESGFDCKTIYPEKQNHKGETMKDVTEKDETKQMENNAMPSHQVRVNECGEKVDLYLEDSGSALNRKVLGSVNPSTHPSAIISSSTTSIIPSALNDKSSVADLVVESIPATDGDMSRVDFKKDLELSARPTSLRLKSPQSSNNGEDSDPHDSGNSSFHKEELMRALHQHNREIDDSLTVKQNVSGDDSSTHSSIDLRFDEHNDENDYDRNNSLLCLATTDVARSKDRLVFERLDSENSDPGIVSPMSEAGHLSPVSEIYDNSPGTVSFVQASNWQNVEGMVFPENELCSSGGFEPSDPNCSETPPETESVWTPQKHKLEELSLYIQGHSDTLLVLLLDKGTVCDKENIHSLWKSSLSHLAELDFEVKNVERYQRDDMENPGSCYHYMHYDSFTQNLIGSAKFPVTNLANEMVDACVRMHEDFNRMPDLEDSVYRSHTAACYGCRSISGEVYFQIGAQAPIGGNVYRPGDKTFYLDTIAKALLKKDHNISIY